MDGKRVHIEFQYPVVLFDKWLFFFSSDRIYSLEDMIDTPSRVFNSVQSHFCRRRLQTRLECIVDLGLDLHRKVEVQVGVRLGNLHLNTGYG